MTGKDFVNLAKIQACDGAIEATLSTLENSLGPSPSQGDVKLSTWYRSLSPDHQSVLKAVVVETAQQAVFSFFALLDGVASLGKSRLEGRLLLFYGEEKE